MIPPTLANQLWQALASWKLVNWLLSQCPAGKEPLLLNMDETSVAYFMQPAPGTVCRRSRRKGRVRPTDKLTQVQLRSCITHVAVICNDREIQRRLPQLLLTNEVSVKAGELADIQAAMPANVKVIRGKSAWISKEKMLKFLDLLGDALAPFVATRHAILMLDCCASHMDNDFITKAVSRGFYLSYVPASLTWLLQPCDVHAFAGYKRRLRELYMKSRLDNGERAITSKEWLQNVAKVIRQVLEARCWKQAFLTTGWGGNQEHVGPFIRRQLKINGAADAGSTKPGLHILRAMFKSASVKLGALVDQCNTGFELAAVPAPPAAPLLAPKRRVRERSTPAAIEATLTWRPSGSAGPSWT